MRKKKKFFQKLSILLAGAICFGTGNVGIVANAETADRATVTKVYLAEDFEGYEGLGKAPAGFEFTGVSNVKKTSGAMKNDLTADNGTSVALRIEEKEQDKPDVGVAKRFGGDVLTGEFIIDFDIKPLDSNGTRFIEIQDSGKKGLTIASLADDGSMKLEGKSSKIQLKKGEWNRVSFVISFGADKQTAMVYVDGVKALSEEYVFINTNKAAGMNYLRVREKRVVQSELQEDAEGNKNFTTLVDNLRVYSGTELKTMEELKEMNVPDSLLDFDNDLGISIDARLAGSLAMVVNSQNVIFDKQKEKDAVAVQNKPMKLDGQVVVPLSFVCRTFGGSVSLDAAGRQATVSIGGVDSVVTSQKVETGGEVVADSGIFFTSDDVLIPLQAAGKVLNKPVYTDYKGRGLIVIGSGADMFDDSKDVVDAAVDPKNNEKFFIERAIKDVVYDSAVGDEAIALLKSRNAAHPRIIATESDFDRIRQMIGEGEPNITKWYQDISKQGEKHLAMPLVNNDLPDGRRMIGSRQVGPLVINLGMLFHLSDDPVKKEAYKDRIWAEVSTAAGFPDWNESNEFLNTAEFMEGLAIAYDWLYEEWTPQQRKILEDAIIQKGLIKSLEAYNNNVWWIHTYPRANNWNAVCNGAASIALMAIGDIDREIELPSKEKVSMERFGGKVLDIAFNALEDFILLEFTPDGAWSEGPSYWKYTFEYLVKCMSSLETALGTSYGYDLTPGLDKTAYFPIYLSGPVGALNYGDASSNKVIASEELWVAKKYGDKKLASIHLDNKIKYKNAGSEFEMLWYEPDSYLPDQKPDLDQYFSGTQVATFRSKWEDPNTSFLGLKAGNNVVSHGHYDLGSFVFESLGQQWAIDLGKDDYNLPGYSNYEKERLTYYRLNPEGHNTLVINPDGGAQQNIKAYSKIDRMESKPRGGFAIADLSDAYAGQVDTAKRGVMLSSNRTRATIQDEVIFSGPSQVYWFMHTEAQVEVSQDGKSAILSKGGEKLWVGLNGSVSDGDAGAVSPVFDVMDAKPLPVSPNPDKQNQNVGIRKLFVKMDHVKEMTLTVTMIPIIGSLEESDKIVKVVPLENWNISDGDLSIPVLDSVSLDGALMESFDPQVFGHDINLPLDRTEVPVLTYTYDDTLYDVQMTPAASVPGSTRLIVTSKESPEIKSVYHFHFKLVPTGGEEELLVNLPVNSVSSSDAQVGNPDVNAIDGDFNTYWGAEGDQWIRLDLGEVKTINSIAIAFIRGNERSFKFDIETSSDGENWLKAYSGSSSGESLDLEKVYLRQHDARYVRITGHGNSTNQWNSYGEIRIYQLPSKEVDQSRLEELLKQAGEFLLGEYDQDSLAVLKAAMETAQAIYDDPEAAQAQVDEAAAQLKEAIDALVPLTGKAKLEKAINSALEQLKEENKYTQESAANLKAAYDAAKMVFDDTEATDLQAEEALQALNAAVEALTETCIIDKTVLADLIRQAEGYQAHQYTQSSFLALTEAIKKAKAQADSQETTQEKVNQAVQFLLDAIAALETAPDQSVSDNDNGESGDTDNDDTGNDNTGNDNTGNDNASNENMSSYKEPEADWKQITSQVQEALKAAAQNKVQKAIKDVKAAAEETVLNVVTGTTIQVPQELFGMMKDQAVTVAFHTGHGSAFSISGKQITDTAGKGTMNLSIRKDAGRIPADLVAAKMDSEAEGRQISMADSSYFGMVVNLHLDMKAANRGRFANLYLYNSQAGQLEYMGSFQIADNGQAMFGIRKGGEYLVTVTGRKPNEKIPGIHITGKGDTLNRIAAKYKLKAEDLIAANPGLKMGDKVKPGQTIFIR